MSAKQVAKSLLLVLIAVLLITISVLAYSYSASIQVIEADVASYDELSIITVINNEYLADNGYIKPNALDTRILKASTPMPWMVVTNKTLFSSDITRNTQTNFTYTLGNDDEDDFDIISGYGGYVTVTDCDDLELGDGFEIVIKGYINTDFAANKNLVNKDTAFKFYISAEDTLQAEITGGATVTAADLDSDNYTVMVKADGINLEIYVDDMVTPVHSQPIGVAVPNEATNWLLFQNNVMPYVEYVKIKVG